MSNPRGWRFRYPAITDRNVIVEAHRQARNDRAAKVFAASLGITVPELWAAWERVQRPGTWAGKGGAA